MLISKINPNNYLYKIRKNNQTGPVSFCANPLSGKLAFESNDFFINMAGYGKNEDWAKKIIETADIAAKNIREKKSSDYVLNKIATGIREATKENYTDDLHYYHSGILRTKRNGFGEKGFWAGKRLVTSIIGKYSPYEKRLRNIKDNPLKNPFDDIDLTRVEKSRDFCGLDLVHSNSKTINNALDRVNNIYENLQGNYISKPKTIDNNKLDYINSDIGQIRWIMAHATPWERGSDAISNVFMRALYKSMGIKTYPIKKGMSLDMEAFCTPMEEYQKNFHNYFEKNPNVV